MNSYDGSREQMGPATQAFMSEVGRQSRADHPERYAPNGEPLIGYQGSSWTERRASWYEQHGYPAERAVPGT